MDRLFDDVSRIIASPISRRKALRRVCEAVGGAVLASLGLERITWAQTPPTIACPEGLSPCTDKGAYCCGANQTCCQGKCCKQKAICCNGKCCKPGPLSTDACSGANCTHHRRLESEAVAGAALLSVGVVEATRGSSSPCPKGLPRCGGVCCASDEVCCGSKCVESTPSASSPCP